MKRLRRWPGRLSLKLVRGELRSLLFKKSYWHSGPLNTLALVFPWVRISGKFRPRISSESEFYAARLKRSEPRSTKAARLAGLTFVLGWRPLA